MLILVDLHNMTQCPNIFQQFTSKHKQKLFLADMVSQSHVALSYKECNTYVAY